MYNVGILIRHVWNLKENTKSINLYHHYCNSSVGDQNNKNWTTIYYNLEFRI